MSLIPSIFGGKKTNVFDPLSLETWDPFRDCPFLQKLASFPDVEGGEVAPRIDWKETPEAHVFVADLPGVKKEEVKVAVEEGSVVVISGERAARGVEHGEGDVKWRLVERSGGGGKFLRRFRLPENVMLEEVKASLEDGVLTVVVPKAEVKKPEVKAIEISG